MWNRLPDGRKFDHAILRFRSRPTPTATGIHLVLFPGPALMPRRLSGFFLFFISSPLPGSNVLNIVRINYKYGIDRFYPDKLSGFMSGYTRVGFKKNQIISYSVEGPEPVFLTKSSSTKWLRCLLAVRPLTCIALFRKPLGC